MTATMKSRPMTEAERKLLVWCGVMLVRDATLTPSEADEIDQLIADVRAPLPAIEWRDECVGTVIPPLPAGARAFALGQDGQWYYVNHAGTWQTCPPPV